MSQNQTFDAVNLIAFQRVFLVFLDHKPTGIERNRL